MNTLPEELVNNIMMFNNRPCADLINLAANDEYNNENRECNTTSPRVIVTCSGRNVKSNNRNIMNK